MGTVLLPLLLGLEKTRTVPKACSLCSFCSQTCPVKIPLPDLLLELRNDLAKLKSGGLIEAAAMNIGAWVLKYPGLYRLGQKMMRLGLLPLSRNGWVKWLPSIPGQWTKVKDLPLPAKRTFLKQKRSS
jgi:L-lactate dehydrogenase complex protein LldF